eukprot:5681143-Amphidinium_carterae.1
MRTWLLHEISDKRSWSVCGALLASALAALPKRTMCRGAFCRSFRCCPEVHSTRRRLIRSSQYHIIHSKTAAARGPVMPRGASESLGLDILYNSEHAQLGILIKAVLAGGIIDRWNEQAPPAMRVNAGDSILAVNEYRGDIASMLAELGRIGSKLLILSRAVWQPAPKWLSTSIKLWCVYFVPPPIAHFHLDGLYIVNNDNCMNHCNYQFSTTLRK